jgi:hypothetical protein
MLIRVLKVVKKSTDSLICKIFSLYINNFSPIHYKMVIDLFYYRAKVEVTPNLYRFSESKKAFPLDGIT